METYTLVIYHAVKMGSDGLCCSLHKNLHYKLSVFWAPVLKETKGKRHFVLEVFFGSTQVSDFYFASLPLDPPPNLQLRAPIKGAQFL